MKNTSLNEKDFFQATEKMAKRDLKRRDFVRMAGAGAAGVALLGWSACKKDPMPGEGGNGFYFGTGDVAILNYAYALEQLEAAFYTQVMRSPYAGISDWEKQLMTDLRDHEIAHREFFKQALGNSAIDTLSFNLSTVDFSKRDVVLATAKAFEDLGVSAYNGAGWLISNEAYLLLAGKIVSVEARHAALIRDLIDFGTFADSDVIDSNGLDLSKSPTEVLGAAAPFITSALDVTGLPTY